MKLKAIASIFKKYKQLILFSAPNGVQWICDGSAMYSLSGMPLLKPENILRIFDIPSDKFVEWKCSEKDITSGLDVNDFVPGEQEIEPLKTYIVTMGKKYWLFVDKARVYAFDESYIKPLLDEYETLTFYKRSTSNGGFLLALKVGLLLTALIAPTALHTYSGFTDDMHKISSLLRQMEREQDQIANAADVLKGFDVESSATVRINDIDPQTGEIYEQQQIGIDDAGAFPRSGAESEEKSV